MIKILFVCHGNICRSPMAEFLFKHMVREAGMAECFFIDSAATSTEEIGNPVDRRAASKLKEHGIECGNHRAKQVTKKDYDTFDYLILMDMENLRGIKRIIPEDPGNKIHFLLEYAGLDRDVADPWYTQDFEKTYEDLVLGCSEFLKDLRA